MIVRTHTPLGQLEEAAAALNQHDAQRLPLVGRVAELAQAAKEAGVPAADIATIVGVDRAHLYRPPWNLPRGIRGRAR